MLVRQRKAIKFIFLALIIAISLLALSPVTIEYNTPQAFLLNLKLFYGKIVSSSLQLDEDADFQQKLLSIIAEKLRGDSASSLYFLRPDYVPPTKVKIPHYYKTETGGTSKPSVQPFDPRFTLSVYYKWISENPDKPVAFHWSDWVDFSILNKYVLLPQSKKESCESLFSPNSRMQTGKAPALDYCVDDKNSPLGFRITKFPKAQDREKAKMLGKAYLYSAFPTPSKLVFMTNSRGSYHINLQGHENNLESSLLKNGMPESVFGSSADDTLDVLGSYTQLLRTQEPNNLPSESPAQINLEESWFDMDVDEEVSALESSQRSSQEGSYLSSLKFSKSTTKPEKSFREAKISRADKQSVLGDHYDWRFFNGLTINTDKQVFALHRLIKNYLHFCRSHGIVTWIAHGSLLSWYWNGMVFPWDADTDVQMPLRDLHKLAREFNQTLVIENVGHDLQDTPLNKTDFNGLSSFFIDVGTSITHRSAENGLNNIDARFIDINTGLYVDITGLAVSSDKAPWRYGFNQEGLENRDSNKEKKLYNCRNRHFASLSELSPLTKAVVQNEVGYIPQNFSPLLEQEYGTESLSNSFFSGYSFSSSLRIWIKTNTVLDYVKDPVSWVDKHSGSKKRTLTMEQMETIGNLTESDLTNLLYDPWILREFVTGQNFTQFHESQMKYLLSSRMGKYRANAEEYAEGSSVNRPIWADVFINEIEVNQWSYADEVRKLEALATMYSEEEKDANGGNIA